MGLFRIDWLCFPPEAKSENNWNDKKKMFNLRIENLVLFSKQDFFPTTF